MSISEPQTLIERVLKNGEEVTHSDLFDVLSNERRRILLSVLPDQSTPVDAADLARTVAAREESSAPEDVSAELVRDVHVTLHHVHLPKLDDAELLEYDAPAGDVRSVSLEGFL
jgi:hypothetical protein